MKPTGESRRLGKVLVTGGAGAIGSRLLRRLLEENPDQVVVVDDLSSGYEWLLPADERIQLLKGDVCNLPKLDIEADQPLVFHLAAFFANQNSVDHPLDDIHTNGVGTLTALLWAREHCARRLVYASAGCSMAGHDVDSPIREDMPLSLHLDTPYQITKALGELYCNYFDANVPTVRCRFFNSYGPGELPGIYRNVVPNFIWRALTGQPLVITGTGDETRDFIYVDDLVGGLIKAATVPAARGEAFNFGTGTQARIGDLAEMVIKTCRSHSRIEHGPRRSWDKSLRRVADIEKAAKVLDFKARVSLAEGIERTVAWHKENAVRIESAVRCAP